MKSLAGALVYLEALGGVVACDQVPSVAPV